MERVGSIIKAQQSEGSTALARPGINQLSRDSLIQLGTVLKQMSAAMPHQEYGEETTDVFLMAYEDLALEFGVKPLETALRSFLTRQSFFPHPKEAREALEEMAKKAKADLLAKLPKIGCEKCQGEDGFQAGLVMVQKPGQPRIVDECECKLAWRRAKRELEEKA